MPDISVPWGRSTLNISLPQPWRLQVAAPQLRPAQDDWTERLARALTGLAEGESLPKLLTANRHGRIVIVVEDLTRTSPLEELLAVVLREIRHVDISDEQIEIFFANGMHPPMTAEQVTDKLGETCKNIRWRCNQYDVRANYVSLGEAGGVNILVDRGVAEADLRILISSVSPHLQAGFGGGYKMFFPGCAHLDTIFSLHRKGLTRVGRQLVGMDVTVNPMRRAIDSAGSLLEKYHGRTFAIQYLLDDAHLPATIATGNVLSGHRMIAKQCSAACGVVVSRGADVLIVNAHPLDFDLWQSFKSIANTRWAARSNGVIICLARCEGGLHGMKIPPWPLSPTWTRRIVRWIGSEPLSSMVSRVAPGLAGDAAFFVRMAMQIIHRNVIFIVSPNLADAGIRFPGLELFGDVDEAIAAAERLLGGGSQRVIVFPSGGRTFPIVPSSPAAGRL